MWDPRGSSVRGRQLLPRRVSPSIPIAPPFHVSPPFQGNSSPLPPLRSSPSFPAPSPPLRRLSPHCPPLVVSPVTLHHSSSFPSPPARPHLPPPSPVPDSGGVLYGRRADAAGPRETLQSVIDKKDVKISLLERCLRDLDDRVKGLRSSAARSSEEREEELRKAEALRSHCAFMRSQVRAEPRLSASQASASLPPQVEQMKRQLGQKDGEILSLRTKLDTVKNQLSDSGQHVKVLKESLRAKEQSADILQSEVESLRARVAEKDSLVSQKNQQVSALMEEKISGQTECRDLKDVMEMKERKVGVLLKKLENMQDHLRDKNKQMDVMREQVQSLQLEASKSDSALTALEGALAEKERMIQKMTQQQEASKELGCGLKVELTSAPPAPQMGPQPPACPACLDWEKKLHQQEKLQEEVSRLTELLSQSETQKGSLEDQVQQLERQVKDLMEKLDRLDQNSLKIQMEQLLASMEKMKQELQVVRDKLASAQLSLAEKENHLTRLRQEKERRLEEVLAIEQGAPLSSISERRDQMDMARREKEDLRLQTRVEPLAQDEDHKSGDEDQASPEHDDEDGIWA
ncbi:ELKS/Rab6-interacting/CAST family member 1-like [Synchiropus splendidus]|uniref:ELKS/Rab6-interacting/CAST family member 1-like n=1 Tax=Synchiropus splendidus TaxID=270530 RepID=UPI00237EE1FC|nr:ELKS/Rab6-interacting/CAST family member 1-like [Synchiropus splendidus]